MDKTNSYVKCPYCNTTILIQEKDTRQTIQPVVVLTRDETSQVKQYGKRFDDMTKEEFEDAMHQMFEGIEQERITQLERKRVEGNLTPQEERELAFYHTKSTDPNFRREDYCQSCFRKYEQKYHCGAQVWCDTTTSAGTCGNADCESTSKFVMSHPIGSGRPFSLYCPNCASYVCRNCYGWRDGFFGTKYYCQKCQSRLEKKPALGK